MVYDTLVFFDPQTPDSCDLYLTRLYKNSHSMIMLDANEYLFGGYRVIIEMIRAAQDPETEQIPLAENL